VEGNILENSWADAQDGTAILMTPRSSAGTGTNNCTLCVDADITFRYNILNHAANGLSIAGEDDNSTTLPSQRISIHDNLFLDVTATWGTGPGGTGRLYNVGAPNGTLLAPHDMVIDHNIGFEDLDVVFVGPNPLNPAQNFTFTNNVNPYAANGIAGQMTASGTATLATYFTPYTVTNNIFEGAPSSTSSSYPAGNFWPTDWSTVFVNFTGGDYHILSTSPYHNGGTDAEDPGADIDAVTAATNGVTP
jgi:hypothetical protein